MEDTGETGSAWTAEKAAVLRAAYGFQDGDDEALSSLLLATLAEKRYFEDPVFTFEDSIHYGCSVDLTFEELEAFCTEGLVEHLMIF